MDMTAMVRRMHMDPRVGTFLKFPTKETLRSEYCHGRVMREHPLFNNLDPQRVNEGKSTLFFFFQMIKCLSFGE